MVDERLERARARHQSERDVLRYAPHTNVSKTLLIEAVKALDLAAMRTILDAKPALLTVTDQQGRGLLHLACSVECEDLKLPASAPVRVVNFLLDRGLDIEAPVGKDKCTVLFFAVARSRNPALVKLLIKRGANVRSAPGGGLSAAGWWDDVTNLKLLIDAGAEVDVGGGMTPFLSSWMWRKFEAAKYLATRGANVNVQDSKGKTALHHGVEKEFDPGLLTWLVKHGASPDIEDREGITARQKASRKRDKKFFEALA